MRLLALTLAAMLAMALPSHATQEYHLPSLFDVAEVAADDVLNIRQRPYGSSPIIGSLAPDASDIEVVEERRGWGRINMGEVSGWVSMRYLTYQVDVWEAGQLPGHFRCLGTEPFWNIAIRGDELEFSSPDQSETEALRAVLDTGVFRYPSRVILGETLTLVATPNLCSDGMSDRQYGLDATVIRDGEQPEMLRGCCLIQP